MLKQHSELCFPPLLTIQIYHVDSKTTGTFPAKNRSRVCHLFLFFTLMYFILMSYPYLIFCVTAPYATPLGIYGFIKLLFLNYTTHKKWVIIKIKKIKRMLLYFKSRHSFIHCVLVYSNIS